MCANTALLCMWKFACAQTLYICMTVVCMCAGTLATEAKTCGKYHNFQVNFYVFKGPVTIMRSHRNRTCSLTPSLRRPCIHAIFFPTACRTACKHAFCFLRVRPEAVSTRHSWLWQTLDREHASVPPDKRHCRQGMSERNGMSEWIFA